MYLFNLQKKILFLKTKIKSFLEDNIDKNYNIMIFLNL